MDDGSTPPDDGNSPPDDAVRESQEPRRALYIGSSIAHHCDINALEEEFCLEIITRKAYGSVKNQTHRFPRKNTAEITRREMERLRPSILVLEASPVDTNELSKQMGKLPEAIIYEKARESSRNVLKTAERALRDHPELEKVIITERPPHYGGEIARMITEIANRELYRRIAGKSGKIHLGEHSLECVGYLRAARYGMPEKQYNYDGFHLRGPDGKQAYTSSIKRILRQANI